MISIEHVSKSYAKSSVKAVDDINLHVKRSEVFGFIGPNGAGKTTTIKMLTGILQPDQGQIKINGYDTVSTGRGQALLWLCAGFPSGVR